MSDLVDAIKAVQAMIRDVRGVRAAPDFPPDAMNLFPFVVAFPGTGTVQMGAQGVRKGLHNIRVQLHVARKDLGRDVELASPFIDSITDKLLGDVTLGGTVATFGRVRYEFKPMKWEGTDTIGWELVIEDVKQETVIST